MLRWSAVVVPTAIVLTGAFGTTGAYAAAGGNAAAQAATAGADANHGVGKGIGNGNDKHAVDTTTTVAPIVATTTVTPVDVPSSSVPSSSVPSSSSAASHQVDCTATPSDPLCSVQPLSTADQNSRGANGQCLGGPYCSTRDGAGSGNGNQTQGKHTGEPCAGCVGKADNKNPQGQKPDGSDRNAGYECDRNHGIGRTNPAHTGCTSTPPPTVCAAPNTLVGGVCTPPATDCTTNPAAAGCTQTGGDCTTHPAAAGCQRETASGDCTINPTAAGCDNTGGGTVCTPTKANGFCSTVLGEKVTNKPTVQGEQVVKTPSSVQGEQVVTTPSSLPFTGANVAVLLLAAGAGLTAGTALLVAGRRRRPAPGRA